MNSLKKEKVPLVSVIVTTKNEEQNIGNCLQSIKAQTYPKDCIEIVVVDNNSIDKTKEIALRFTKKVFNKGPERSAQRNYGIEKSKGKYVVYLDADMILSPTVIERSVEKFQNQNSKSLKFNIHNTKYNDVLVALYIPEIILGNSYWSRVRRFERSFYDGTVIDCVRFVKKEIFEKVGGFDSSMTGPEDWDFDKKVRKVGEVGVLDMYDFKEIDDKLMKIDYQKKTYDRQLIQLSSSALIYHNEAKFNLEKYLEKKSYYAKSFSTYINKWSRKDGFASYGIKVKNDPDIKKQFGFWYRYFGVFVEKGKWKFFYKYPKLIFGVIVLRFMVGINYFFKK